MTRHLCCAVIGFVVLIQSALAGAGQFSTALEQYQLKTQALVAKETDPDVKEYLIACLTGAKVLDGAEAGDPRLPNLLHQFVTTKLTADGKLPPGKGGTPGVQGEDAAYNATLQPYAKAVYINLVALQDQLLERKYFKAETAKNANFLEGYINSRWSLTRADHSDINKVMNQRHLGVSPWEAIFRFEPTLAFEHGAQAAIMGTAGLSYTFFPEVDRNQTPFTFREDFWSEWVQKSGIRFGLGVGNLDDRAKLLVGAGTQINALGLWGIYKPDGSSFLFGLSASDLSKFKKVLSWMD